MWLFTVPPVDVLPIDTLPPDAVLPIDTLPDTPELPTDTLTFPPAVVLLALEDTLPPAVVLPALAFIPLDAKVFVNALVPPEPAVPDTTLRALLSTPLVIFVQPVGADVC